MQRIIKGFEVGRFDFEKRRILIDAAKTALPYTLPMLAGFSFLGGACGIFMRASGFSELYSILLSVFIYAGTMEFVTIGLLLSSFDPFYAFFMTIMVNGRHMFYGISMLDKYKNIGKKKILMIMGLTDESFAINYLANVPKDVDRGWFMFFVSAYNYLFG